MPECTSVKLFTRGPVGGDADAERDVFGALREDCLNNSSGLP